MRLLSHHFQAQLRNVVHSKGKNKKKVVQPLIDHYSRFSPSPLSLRQFIDFAQKTGDEKSSFLWLRQELPTRLANMMKEMNRLPDSLLAMPSTSLVTSWYQQSFEDVVAFDKNKTDTSSLESFNKSLQTIIQRHRNVVETMAQGIIEWKERCNGNSQPEDYLDKIQYFLDRFYTSRIGIRILINQHILLFGDTTMRQPNLYGTIDANCDVPLVVEDAYNSAKFLCEQYYLGAPDMKIEVVNSSDKCCKHANIIYVPSHLHHICFELFKNAMRATMEKHNDEDCDTPPIIVSVTKGDSDCGIRISDRGGGASRQITSRWFEYMYSTAPTPPRCQDDRVAPLAGYGYGLPISRLYARYLGGDLEIQSMEGHGTDAYVYLKSLSSAAVETVPVYNSSTTEHYRRPQLHGDWVVPAKQKRKDFRNPFNGHKIHH